VTLARDGVLLAEFIEQATSPQSMRDRALRDNVVLFRCGATVSTFDAHGNLLSIDGDAAAWMSEQLALLAAQDELIRRAPRAFVALAQFVPAAPREELLSEIFDEIETAREQGLPIRRRYLSAALRAIPSEIWHARLSRQVLTKDKA
jgi:hypothetical protein